MSQYMKSNGPFFWRCQLKVEDLNVLPRLLKWPFLALFLSFQKPPSRQSLSIWISFVKPGLNIFIENILLPQTRALMESPETCIQMDTSCESEKGQEWLSSGVSDNVISHHFWFELPMISKCNQLGILPENFVVFAQNLSPWRKFWRLRKFGYSVFYIPAQISSINSLTTACFFNNFMWL